ncbi:MAG TPA: glycosyl hydrolase 108 family protein [Candidatus Binataceae bacterium]|nr:glycosyl hydrolase 108 family protein [Candidatus Binataceae bacterium]
MTDDQIVDVILKNEGGFTDNPNDHGGPTNFGITAADYGRWLKRDTPASADEVRAMDRQVARQIYKKWYLADPGFDQITEENLGALKLILADSGVLFGVRRATMWLQQELGIVDDGRFGPATLQALHAYREIDKLSRRVLGRRIQKIAEIVAANRSQATFLRGWINRAVSLLDYV